MWSVDSGSDATPVTLLEAWPARRRSWRRTCRACGVAGRSRARFARTPSTTPWRRLGSRPGLARSSKSARHRPAWRTIVEQRASRDVSHDVDGGHLTVSLAGSTGEAAWPRRSGASATIGRDVARRRVAACRGGLPRRRRFFVTRLPPSSETATAEAGLPRRPEQHHLRRWAASSRARAASRCLSRGLKVDPAAGVIAFESFPRLNPRSIFRP